MPTTIAEVKTLLDRLPENSHLEDIQYHLCVMEKIQSGLQRAEDEGTVSQADVDEQKFYSHPTLQHVNDGSFDYIEWQKQLWQDESVESLSEKGRKLGKIVIEEFLDKR